MADDSNKKLDPTLTKTLTDDDIVEQKPVQRRSVLQAVGAVLFGSTVASVLSLPSSAEAQNRRRTGRTNSDPNDGPGYGRTGITDSDPSDGAGYGRGGRRGGGGGSRASGTTDRDSGPGADGPGRGVCRSRGHTDSDSGGGADGAGQGRGPCH